jgi:hypothetical protein
MSSSRLLVALLGLVAALAAGCAASRDEPPAVETPGQAVASDTDLAKVRSYLQCARHSSGPLAQSNRMAACRVLDEFQHAGSFSLFPETGDETWIGRWYDCPHPAIEVATPSPLVLVRLRISSFDLGPEALRLLPIDSVLPYSVRSLALVDPQERPGCADLVEALAAGGTPPSPQLARQLTASTTQSGEAAWVVSLISPPSAIARTRGVSLQFHDVLGRDPHVRQASDGRMLMVSNASAFELWRIPAPGSGAPTVAPGETDPRAPRR